MAILKVNFTVVFDRARTTILFISTHFVYTFVLYNSLSKILINLSEGLRKCVSSLNKQILDSRSRAGPEKKFLKYPVSWTKKFGLKQILTQEG